MDYKKLLEKYMRLVRQCEGIDFLDHIDDPFKSNDVQFDAAERAELERMSKRKDEPQVSITVNEDGSARKESGSDNGEFARKLEEAVRAVIIREKRPGGMLE